MARPFKKLFGFGPWRKGVDLVLVIQQQGIERFNDARSKNPRWRPDFSGASLSGLDLSNANVKAANLVGADLNGVIIDNLEMDDERARPRLAKRGAIVD
ncbi:MAG: pentapeptide repeat-containing protein [Anaerolineae bacterium]|nr:pentapeptide repeat-containing protein [Anaerolineae bacterium]